MNSADNPYVPGAGFPPPALIGRDELVRDALVTMKRIAKGVPSKSFIFVGLRGVGKTVLLLKIQEDAQILDFKAAMIECEEAKPLAGLMINALLPILLELSVREKVGAAVRKGAAALRSFASAFKINLHGFEVEIKEAEQAPMTGDISTDLTELIRTVGLAAKETGTAVVLLVDEIQYLSKNDLCALIQALHKAGQTKLPVVMFGAGLANILERAGEARSYAERLFLFPRLESLPPDQAELVLTDPAKGKMDYTEEAIRKILKSSSGYPYFLQQWGYQCWECTPTTKPVTDEKIAGVAENLVTSVLDRDIFLVRYQRTTESERKYMRALGDLGAGAHATGDIARALGKAPSDLSTPRDGLLKKGVVYSPEHGKIEFTVPLFHEFIRRHHPDVDAD